MKFSIITPSYNQGRFLESTVQSVLSQDYPNLEYIIIDGGSTDDSVAIVKKFDHRIAYWVSEKDKGQSHAFNKGLKKATGDIIGWLNSDDVYLNHCFFDAAEYFEKHPGIDIVFSDFWYIDEEGKFIKRRKEIPFQKNIYLWTGDCYHTNCAGFFRRRVFDTLGGLDEDLHYSMDYDFYLRAARAGFSFGHQRGYWGAYRLHTQSKTISSSSLMKREKLLISSYHLPRTTTRFGLWYRYWFFKFFRLGWKFIIGGYPTAAIFDAFEQGKYRNLRWVK